MRIWPRSAFQSTNACTWLPEPALLLHPDPYSAKSFVRAQHWIAELQRQASQRPLMVLVGNKTDLPAEERVVAQEAAEELAERWALHCVMCRVARFCRSKEACLGALPTANCPAHVPPSCPPDSLPATRPQACSRASPWLQQRHAVHRNVSQDGQQRGGAV